MVNINGINIGFQSRTGHHNKLELSSVVVSDPLQVHTAVNHVEQLQLVRSGTLRFRTNDDRVEHYTTTHVLASFESQLISSIDLRKFNLFAYPTVDGSCVLTKQSPCTVRLLIGAVINTQRIKVSRPFSLRMRETQDRLVDGASYTILYHRLQVHHRSDQTSLETKSLIGSITQIGTTLTCISTGGIQQVVARLGRPQHITLYRLLRPSLRYARLKALRQNDVLSLDAYRQQQNCCQQKEINLFHKHNCLFIIKLTIVSE